VDRGDGASSYKEGSPKAKGIGLTSREDVGGELTGLGVILQSGSSGDIRGAIAGNCVNENVITSRPEAAEECWLLGVVVQFSSVVGVSSEEEESNSVNGGGVCDLSGLLSRLDSSDNFALASLSTVMASVEGPRERGKLEERSASCRGTIDAFPGEGISCPRSRRRMVGESKGNVCARCVEDSPGCSRLVQGSSSGLTAEKSNGPLGRLVSVTAS
jgi:hypothetical protein